MAGAIAESLDVKNASPAQRQRIMKIINNQMLFMTRQTFGYFYTIGGRKKEELPTEEIEEAIGAVFGFTDADEN